MKIMFVCLGNICRSPMCHGVFQYYVNKNNLNDYIGKIDSCGLYGEPEGEDTHYGTQEIIQEKLGFKFNKKSMHYRKQIYDQYDLIFVMDQSNYYDLMHELTQKQKQQETIHQKIFYLRDLQNSNNKNVQDPYYTNGFESVFNTVDDCCKILIKMIQQKQ